jgi:hypothetical protein
VYALSYRHYLYFELGITGRRCRRKFGLDALRWSPHASEAVHVGTVATGPEAGQNDMLKDIFEF